MSDTPIVNLKINQGATFRYQFTWQNTRGHPIDLTGFTASMQIRPDSTALSTTVLTELTTVNGGIVLGNKLGTVSLYIASSVTTELLFSKSAYDIRLTSPSGDVFRLVSGAVSVSLEVTR